MELAVNREPELPAEFMGPQLPRRVLRSFRERTRQGEHRILHSRAILVAAMFSIELMPSHQAALVMHRNTHADFAGPDLSPT
jgi:hypothetical protein